MNKIILLLIFLPNLIFAQKSSGFHELSIDVFNQLQIPGQSKYFNDSWLMDNYGGDEQNPQKRKYVRFGFGLEYTLGLKNKNQINFDFGIGYRNIFEQTSYYFPNPSNHPDEVVQGATEVSYEQISYGLSIYYGKYLELNNFKLNIGIGPSYLLQSIGKQEWNDWWTENVYPNLPADSTVTLTKSKFGIGHNFGVGMKLSAQYYFGKKFSIGCDLSWHLFYSMYNNPSSHETEYYQRKSYDGITIQETFENYKSEDFTEFNQLSFTNISPSIKLTYVIK